MYVVNDDQNLTYDDYYYYYVMNDVMFVVKGDADADDEKLVAEVGVVAEEKDDVQNDDADHHR